MNMEILEAAIEEARQREHQREQDRRYQLLAAFSDSVKEVFGSGIPSFFEMSWKTIGLESCAATFTIEDQHYHLIMCGDKQWRVSVDDDRPESQPFLFRVIDIEATWCEPEDEPRRKLNLDRLLIAIGELRAGLKPASIDRSAFFRD